jgi:hypothetical protein
MHHQLASSFLHHEFFSCIDHGAFFEQNDKENYVNAFMDHLVSWNMAMARMARAEAFVNLGEPKIPIA